MHNRGGSPRNGVDGALEPDLEWGAVGQQETEPDCCGHCCECDLVYSECDGNAPHVLGAYVGLLLITLALPVLIVGPGLLWGYKPLVDLDARLVSAPCTVTAHILLDAKRAGPRTLFLPALMVDFEDDRGRLHRNQTALSNIEADRAWLTENERDAFWQAHPSRLLLLYPSAEANDSRNTNETTGTPTKGAGNDQGNGSDDDRGGHALCYYDPTFAVPHLSVRRGVSDLGWRLVPYIVATLLFGLPAIVLLCAPWVMLCTAIEPSVLLVFSYLVRIACAPLDAAACLCQTPAACKTHTVVWWHRFWHTHTRGRRSSDDGTESDSEDDDCLQYMETEHGSRGVYSMRRHLMMSSVGTSDGSRVVHRLRERDAHQHHHHHHQGVQWDRVYEAEKEQDHMEGDSGPNDDLRGAASGTGATTDAVYVQRAGSFLNATAPFLIN